MSESTAEQEALNPDAEPEAQNTDENPDLESEDSESVPADDEGERGEGSEDESSDDGDSSKGKPDPTLAKLTYENRELKRRLAAADQQDRDTQIQSLERELDNPKTLEDFGDDQREYAKYMARLGPMAIKLENLKAEAQSPLGDDSLAEGMDQFTQSEVDFAVQHPDYYQVAYDKNLPLTREMAAYIQSSDNGVQMLYHLGTSKEEAAQIANLPPHAVSGAMRALAIRLRGTAAGGKQSRGVDPGQGVGAGQTRVSNAPPPVKGLEGSGNSGRTNVKASDPKSDNLSDAEWIRRRNKEVFSRR